MLLSASETSCMEDKFLERNLHFPPEFIDNIPSELVSFHFFAIQVLDALAVFRSSSIVFDTILS